VSPRRRVPVSPRPGFSASRLLRVPASPRPRVTASPRVALPVPDLIVVVQQQRNVVTPDQFHSRYAM